MRTGHRFTPKPKERAPKEPDLTRTSHAQRALHRMRKTGTPEQIAELEQKVSDLHPDMLMDRRRLT